MSKISNVESAVEKSNSSIIIIIIVVIIVLATAGIGLYLVIYLKVHSYLRDNRKSLAKEVETK